MYQASEAMERFFRTFEANASSHNVEAQVSQFADVFMAAGPNGVQAVRATDFVQALLKRKQLFDRMGCHSTELVSLTEKWLDTRYALAGTKWKMTFVREEAPPQDIVIESVFILDTGGGAVTAGVPKIVFYLASQDIMQIVKDRGLLSA